MEIRTNERDLTKMRIEFWLTFEEIELVRKTLIEYDVQKYVELRKRGKTDTSSIADSGSGMF